MACTYCSMYSEAESCNKWRATFKALRKMDAHLGYMPDRIHILAYVLPAS